MNVILNAFSTYIEEHFSNFVAKSSTSRNIIKENVILVINVTKM